MARRLGSTEEQLDAMARGEYDLFDDAWRSAFRFADEMTPTPGTVSAATFEELSRHWNATQVVEITSVIAMFAFFNRVAHALAIPITR